MLVLAATALAMLVVMMRGLVVGVALAGHHQRTGEPLLGLAGIRLEHHRGNLGAEDHVVGAAEIVPAQTALAVVDQKRRRAAHLIGEHGLGNVLPIGLVDADGEGELVLVQERLQRLRRHHIMVLENSVEAEHGDVRVIEPLPKLLNLRQRMADAAWTEHLEGEHDNDLAFEVCERRRLRSIEPAGDGKLWWLFEVEHAGSLAYDIASIQSRS